MKRGYEEETLITITKHADEFKNKVRVSIDNEEEKYAFYQALKSYHETGNVKNFINDIKSVINTPKRYPLYKDVRYLINPEHVEDYLKMIPNSPSDGIHMVRVQRFGREPMGFSIRGGKEHSVGIFISLVTRGSQADIVGLKEGDEVLSVNNMILTEATHDEVTNLMKTRRMLLLKVRSTGKVPCKINNVMTWETVEDKDEVYYHPDLLEHLVEKGTLSDEQPFILNRGDKQAFLTVGHKGLGCSIRNGIPGKDGLYVISVTPGSLSDKNGIRVGDQIVAIDGKSIIGMGYSEAVYLLKMLKELSLVLRHSKEAEDFVYEEEAKNNKDKLPEFALKTQLLLKKAEEKEKVRREKAKDEMHFETLARVKSLESLHQEEQATQNESSGRPFQNGIISQSQDGIISQSQDGIISQSQDVIISQLEDGIISQSQDGIISQSQDDIISQSQDDIISQSEDNKSNQQEEESISQPERVNASTSEGVNASPSERLNASPVEGGTISPPEIPVPVATVENNTRPKMSYYTDMTPNTRKRALFTERVQIIQSSPDVNSPANGASPPTSPSFNPSNCEYGEEVLKGRDTTLITVEKVSDLGIELEEMHDGIYVKSVNAKGSIADSGVIYAGDQLLNVEGTNLIGVSLTHAQNELQEAMNRQSNSLDLVVAFSNPQPGVKPHRRRGITRFHKDDATGHEIYDTWL